MADRGENSIEEDVPWCGLALEIRSQKGHADEKDYSNKRRIIYGKNRFLIFHTKTGQREWRRENRQNRRVLILHFKTFLTFLA